MSIGIVGAHRVGKTTLAEEYAARYNIKFLKTNTSQVLKRYGVDPSKKMDFTTRLEVQNHILVEAERQWRAEQEFFITDRTPLDYIMYTLADCVHDVGSGDFKALESYIEQCYKVAERYFTVFVLLQPGIPIVEDENKAVASLNPAYIEHLNALAWGLCNQERLSVAKFYIPRARTDIGERIASVKFCHDVAHKKLEFH